MDNDRLRLELNSFEDCLIQYLSDSFRFSGDYYSNLPLQVGRHLFVQDIPSSQQLIDDAKAAGDAEFDPLKEPTISVYTNGNNNFAPTIGRGGRLEWSLRIVLRLGTVMEEAKAKLEELTEFIELNIREANFPKFVVKGFSITARPTAFQMEDGEQAYCELQARFFAVARVFET